MSLGRILLAAAVVGLGYVFALTGPLDHAAWFVVLIAGFVICDRSFWPHDSA